MVDPPPLIRPTPGPVRSAFRYDRRTPFAAGQRRGVGFAARPGTAVVAPCRGRITFAGRTPRGGAVSVRCGRWTSAVLGVTPTVRPGTAVSAGRTVGRASGAVVGLSLRPVAERWGYVDPRPSLATPRTGTPLGPAPRALRAPAPRRVVRPTVVPSARPAPAPRPVAVPGVGPAWSPPVMVPVEGAPDGRVRVAPWLVGVGLGLAALGLPALRRRRKTPRLWTESRPTVPSIGNGLLRHDTDLLRQRRAPPGARVLDDRR